MSTIGRVVKAKLWVKWTGSGSYSDESAYLMSFSGQVRLAPPLQTIMATRSIVDQVSITLHNTAQRYSSLQTGVNTLTYLHEGGAYHSPMYLEVSINNGSTYTRIFTGVVKYINETAVTGKEAGTVVLDCRSREEEILNTKISSTQTEFAAIYDGAENESQILARWLGDAGLSSGDYSLDDGLYTIPFAWLNDESPVEQGWDLAAACGGRFYMRHLDGKFVYENSTHNLSASSYATLTRADYGGLAIKYPDTDLQKVIVVNVTDYELQPLADAIFTLDKPITVAAGATLVHEAAMDKPAYSAGVVTFTATTSGGTNISADVSIVLTQYSQKLHFSIANANTTYAAVIRKLTVTGQAVASAGSATGATGAKRAYTATSSDSFWSGVAERKREIDNKYVQSYGQAGGLANAVLAANGTPLQFCAVDNVLGDPAIVLGTKLTINDAVVMNGSKTYFVTSISFRFGVTGFFQSLECVEAGQLLPHDTQYFILGAGGNVLGSSTGSIAKLFF